MTAAQFRRLARSFSGVIESSHMSHPDFRVGGKIFATAGRIDGRAVLRLKIDQQQMLCEAEPDMFAPVNNAWGRKGWTNLTLTKANAETAKSALWMAWRNTAPKKLLKAHSPKETI